MVEKISRRWIARERIDLKKQWPALSIEKNNIFFLTQTLRRLLRSLLASNFTLASISGAAERLRRLES